MDRLILLRHGKAETDSVSGQDFDRALTERGARDVALGCRAMAEAGVYPDLVLVSPAARAQQTWEAAAAVFPRAEVKLVPALYEIGPSAILDLARDEGRSVGTVMVVGHNPGLGSLSMLLAHHAPGRTSGLASGFPTAAASVTVFDPPAFDLYTPKALGGGS